MYDLIIIGGGPAGYNAAERACAGGLKTVLFEGRALGGVCLNEGCIPTKTLLYSAKIYDYAKHSSDYGVSFTGASIDHGFVVKRKDKVVKTLVGGVAAKLKKAGCEVVSEFATITGKSAEGYAIKAGGKDYAAAHLLICSGSTPAIPPIPGLKESVASGYALTNREILDLTSIPESLAVIGGGVIGLEMASYFNSVGSKVTVIEMLDHIAGPTDAELSAILLKNYKKKGIEFKLGAKVTSVSDGSVTYELDGKSETIKTSKALVSIGRRAVTQALGLESIGVSVERGAIVTDDHGRTNVPNVWAAGDVNGKSMLAHTAYREGEVCVNGILGKKDKIDYNSIPAVIYTNPEVASVGETEQTAKEKGLNAEVHTMTLRYSGRYIAENEGGDGILKVIIGKEHRNLLGVHMIGAYASEIIYGAAIMVNTAMRIEDVRKQVFPHPTVGEVIRELVFEI
ncbi:MAG: dihydrolipoyl dehydrogenase [Eubacteriales bacterium]